jgi:hypothetical protein
MLRLNDIIGARPRRTSGKQAGHHEEDDASELWKHFPLRILRQEIE